MYVAKCVELFIKEGGFTKDIREAKRFKTIKAAKKAAPYPWVVVKVKGDRT